MYEDAMVKIKKLKLKVNVVRGVRKTEENEMEVYSTGSHTG